MTSVDSSETASRGGPGGAWGSLLSAQDFAAVTSAGFSPVGHVLGTSVVHLGYASRGGRCSTSDTYSARTDLASATSGPFERLLRQRYAVRRRALARAVEQCRELGGDGIVGVTLSIRPFPAGGTEFTVQGTAVRARASAAHGDTARPAEPFSSHLSAPEFARLLRAGWVPTAMVFGIALGARHDDTKTRSQTRRTADGEVKSYTQLVRDTRKDARAQLEKAVKSSGADGVVVAAMTLHIGERECPAEQGRDHVAEAAIVGTAIAAFSVSADVGAQGPLVIMRVNRSPAASGTSGASGLPGLRHDSAGSAAAEPAEDQPADEAEPGSEGGVLDRLAASRAAKRASRSGLSYGDSSGITKRTD